jgi:2'-5' RNA ligase
VIRSFVAILLPEALRETIAATIDGFRGVGAPVAWVPAPNLHLTLHFLGNQTEERLAEAAAALDEAGAACAPLDLSLHGIGAFPGLERPRILWIGVAQGALEARALQARVTDALTRRGFPQEDRAWHPHLTIGRVFDERRWRRQAGPPLRSALARAAATRFGILSVDQIALMRSDLGPGGARYTPQRIVTLAGPTPGRGGASS